MFWPAFLTDLCVGVGKKGKKKKVDKEWEEEEKRRAEMKSLADELRHANEL